MTWTLYSPRMPQTQSCGHLCCSTAVLTSHNNNTLKFPLTFRWDLRALRGLSPTWRSSSSVASLPPPPTSPPFSRRHRSPSWSVLTWHTPCTPTTSEYQLRHTARAAIEPEDSLDSFSWSSTHSNPTLFISCVFRSGLFVFCQLRNIVFVDIWEFEDQIRTS